jgi:hypothetical protein
MHHVKGSKFNKGHMVSLVCGIQTYSILYTYMCVYSMVIIVQLFVKD